MNAIKNAWSWVRTKYSALPGAIRAAWNTAWITFLAMMMTILTDLLGALTDAIGSGSYETFYDQLNLAGSAVVSAATAFLVGVLNAVYRWIRPVEASYPNQPT